MSKTNIAIAVAFHAILLFVIVFFASKEGMLGKKMQTLSVVLVPKSKVEEVVKTKVEQPRVEVPKTTIPSEQPKTQTAPPVAPVQAEVPAVAPAAAQLPSFSFNDGAKEVQNISDPIQLYKSYMEHYLKSKWNTPNNDGIVEIDMIIDEKGRILSSQFQVKEGEQWGASVVQLLQRVTSFPKPPPKGFPSKFKIRFDMVDAL